MNTVSSLSYIEHSDIKEHFLSKLHNLSNIEYTNFQKLILERTGLYFPDTKKIELERGLSRCLDFADVNNMSILYEVLQDQPEESVIWDKLINSLTVNETYFFRSKHHFLALEQHILKDIIQQRRLGNKTLRIWSAGCSTGEEPYSIAILLHEMIPDIKEWSIQIIANDIDKKSLSRAIDGVYEDWSFRKLQPELISKYFRKSGRKYHLHRDIKKMVSFRYLNLIRDSFPSIYTNTTMMDIIFCRNVTIYFHKDIIATIISKFHQSLVPGGWLIVGESEPTPSRFARFECHNIEETFIYRKLYDYVLADTEKKKEEKLLFQKSVQHKTKSFESFENLSVQRKKPVYVEENRDSLQQKNDDQHLEYNHDTSISTIQEASFLANQGKLDQAEKMCRDVLTKNTLAAEAYYLLAMISMERNHLIEAENLLRKSIYLDGKFIMAHFGMYNIYLATEKYDKAKLFFENTRKLLMKLPFDSIVPLSDGMPVKRFLDNLEINQFIYQE